MRPTHPSADGRRLYYLFAPGGAGPRGMMQVAIEREGDTLRAGRPERLFDRSARFFDRQGLHFKYDVSSDDRFITLTTAVEEAATQQTSPFEIVAVLNWVEELKERVPPP